MEHTTMSITIIEILADYIPMILLLLAGLRMRAASEQHRPFPQLVEVVETWQLRRRAKLRLCALDRTNIHGRSTRSEEARGGQVR